MKKIIFISLFVVIIILVVSSTIRKSSHQTNPFQIYPTPTSIYVPNYQNQHARSPGSTIKIVPGSEKKILDRMENKQQLSQQDIDAKNKIASSLQNQSGNPVTNDEFSVDYLHDNDLFMVQILSTKIDQARKDAVSWFVSQGFTIDGLCKLPVTFFLSRDVKSQLPPDTVFNPLPDGC